MVSFRNPLRSTVRITKQWKMRFEKSHETEQKLTIVKKSFHWIFSKLSHNRANCVQFICVHETFHREKILNIFFFHTYEFNCWTCHFENSSNRVWTHDFFDNNKSICLTKIDRTYAETEIVDWILNLKIDCFCKNLTDFFAERLIDSIDKK